MREAEGRIVPTDHDAGGVKSREDFVLGAGAAERIFLQEDAHDDPPQACPLQGIDRLLVAEEIDLKRNRLARPVDLADNGGTAIVRFDKERDKARPRKRGGWSERGCVAVALGADPPRERDEEKQENDRDQAPAETSPAGSWARARVLVVRVTSSFQMPASCLQRRTSSACSS